MSPHQFNVMKMFLNEESLPDILVLSMTTKVKRGSEIAAYLGISRARLYITTSRLRDRDLITYEKKGQNNIYSITYAGKQLLKSLR